MEVYCTHKMRKNIICVMLLVFVISVEMVLGKNKTITRFSKHKKHNEFKHNISKRSPRSAEDASFSIRGKSYRIPPLLHYDIDKTETDTKNSMGDKDLPFWGTRGRRDSNSEQNYNDEYPELTSGIQTSRHICKNCKDYQLLTDFGLEFSKERRDEPDQPFWGNRGRRSSEEIQGDYQSLATFLDKNKDDDPFWGARGRRQDNIELWRNRNNIDIEKYPRNKPDQPFWSAQRWREDVEPLWSNRGRRDDYLPFWGNQGRREESGPFWGNRGRRFNSDAYYSSFHKQQLDKKLKESLLNAIDIVEDEIETLSRFKRSSNTVRNLFWNNRGRYSNLKKEFSGTKIRFPSSYLLDRAVTGMRMKPSESKTVLYNRMFAEEPQYILVERTSRSSSEDDPYFISRGKKKNFDLKIVKTARGRRGVIEELVKTVRNDPFFIARGKKYFENKMNDTDLIMKKELGKTKEVICATIDLLQSKNYSSKRKREIDDTERDRRTILKKLAAQLQIDPYFVSRGKRSEDSTNEHENVLDFINTISTKCH